MLRRRIQSWLLETHGTQFELVRHFLRQQLVIDLISSDQVLRLAIMTLAALACVGPLIVRLYVPKYDYLQSVPVPDPYLAAVHADRLFFISLSMITAGLATAMQWQSLFPNRQDYLALKPLPLRLHQVFLARFLSSFALVTAVITALNVATSVLFPLLASGRWQAPSFGVRYILVHAVVNVGAGLFMFVATIAFHGILLNVLRPRMFDRFSLLTQTLFTAGFVVSVPYVMDIPNWHEMIEARPHWMLFFPPAWFFGLYERWLGTHDRYFVQLSEIAVIALGIAFVVGLGTYFASYHRHAVHVMEQSSPKPSRQDRITGTAARLGEHLIKNPLEHATFAFALQTLRRSRPHKLLMGFWIGIAMALALQTAGPTMVAHIRSGEPWEIWQLQSVLAVPLVIGAVLISALCYVFQVPSETRANWVFRMAEHSGRQRLLNSVERLLILIGLVPGLFLTAPIEAVSVGWTRTFGHAFLVTMVLLLLIEVRLHDWHKIPFTCSHAAGRRNVWQVIGTYALLFGALIPAVTYVEARMLQPLFLLASAGLLSLIYFSLHTSRRMQLTDIPLSFDEGDEPLISGMRLGAE